MVDGLRRFFWIGVNVRRMLSMPRYLNIVSRNNSSKRFISSATMWCLLICLVDWVKPDYEEFNNKHMFPFNPAAI